jgi:homoserine trans-succinylase
VAVVVGFHHLIILVPKMAVLVAQQLEMAVLEALVAEHQQIKDLMVLVVMLEPNQVEVEAVVLVAVLLTALGLLVKQVALVALVEYIFMFYSR